MKKKTVKKKVKNKALPPPSLKVEAKAEEILTCPNCGAENTVTAVILQPCGACGHMI